jgi:acyl-CoA reductase-like NAD-dependent aldehyde dehydrogenase
MLNIKEFLGVMIMISAFALPISVAIYFLASAIKVLFPWFP